jgi:hypothetical protein
MVEVRVTGGKVMEKRAVEVLASVVAASQTILTEEGFPGEFVMFVRMPESAVTADGSDCAMIGTLEPLDAAEFVGAWLVDYVKRLNDQDEGKKH